MENWLNVFKTKLRNKKQVNHLKISDIGLQKLIQHEGSRSHAYKDVAGYSTIGAGHLLTMKERLTGKIKINGLAVVWKKGLQDAEIMQLLKQDVAKFEKAINKKVKVELSQNQFDALLSFVFNVGITDFKNSTLLKRLNNGRYQDVPDQLKRWNKAGGRVVKGLAYRRKAEAKLWKTTAKGQTNDVFS